MNPNSNLNSNLGSGFRRHNFSPRFNSIPRPIYNTYRSPLLNRNLTQSQNRNQNQSENRNQNQSENRNQNLSHNFKDIVISGTFHYPANSRYSSNSVVVCDRCQKRNLLACIGSGDKDLCLPCADLVINGKDNVYPNIYRSEKPNYI